MAKNVGDFAIETAGVGEQVPMFVNGQPVNNIFRARNAAGDLEVHLQADGLQLVAATQQQEQQEPEQPHTPTEQEAQDLGRPDAAGESVQAGSEAEEELQASGPVAGDLGDQSSEDDAL